VRVSSPVLPSPSHTGEGRGMTMVLTSYDESAWGPLGGTRYIAGFVAASPASLSTRARHRRGRPWAAVWRGGGGGGGGVWMLGHTVVEQRERRVSVRVVAVHAPPLPCNHLCTYIQVNSRTHVLITLIRGFRDHMYH
jgi:hypothetical protein